MNRRQYLGYWAVAGAGALAGCQGLLGGSGSCISPPSGAKSALPEDENLDPVVEVDVTDQYPRAVDAAMGTYAAGGNSFTGTVLKFESPEAARRALDTDDSGSDDDVVVGVVRDGRWAAIFAGSSRGSVRAVLKASPAMSVECVESNVEW